MRDERGVSLSVWVAVAMPAFVIAVGLGVDFSGHAAASQEARSIAAEAARAATHEVILSPAGPRLDRSAARRAGERFARDAGYTARVTLRDPLTADVAIQGSYETLFLGMIGVHAISFSVSGTADAVSTLHGEEVSS